MNAYKEQSAILHNLLYKQKQRIGNPELKKKLAFLFCADEENLYRRKLNELAAIINVCEELLIAQKYQRALYYICVVMKKVDDMQKCVEKDFQEIQKEIS